MNENINGRNSAGLSLQPQAVICPKCKHQRTAADPGPAWQCPNCGIAYNKATAQADDAVVHKVIRTSGARGGQEIDRGEWETYTPGVISLSLTGRVGRLRYMAYTWPIMALSMLGMAAAVLVPLHKLSPNIPLMILVGVLWFWLWLRLMALRLHDVNRSAKWLPALWLLPVALAAAGRSPQMMAIGGCLFWVVALLLNILPGTDGDNDYGPPPGPNTFLVKVGAVLFIAFTALAVVANIKYMQYIRSGKVHTSSLSGAQGAADEQAESGSVQTPKEKALAALRQAVQEISSTLPKKIDRVTTLTAAEVHGDTYKVYYSMDPSVHLDASRKELAEQVAKQKICQGSTRTLIDNGISVEYLYTFSGSSAEQTMFVLVPAGSCH